MVSVFQEFFASIGKAFNFAGGLGAGLSFYGKAVQKGGKGAPALPHHFLKQKLFSHVKLEDIKFLHVNNTWDFSLFIEQGISDKK